MKSVTYTLQELKNYIQAELQGDANFLVSGIASLDKAQADQLTFFHDPRYKKYLQQTQAGAIVISEDLAKTCNVSNKLITKNPELAFAQIAALFQYQPVVKPGIHPTAVIGKDCHIASTASIGAHCTIGDRVTIGENTVIQPGCVIGDDCILGDQVWFWSHVTLYHGIKIGNQVTVHGGAVIGSDGFGLVNSKGVWQKFPQLGGVTIGNNVEIGANTTIDRGALEDTIIEEGVKLDNQIQIAHNVQIGAHTAIAGCVAIAGSAKIGKYCMIGGAACINGHIEIGDRVILAGATTVASSIKEPGVYSSAIPAHDYRVWRKNAIRFTQLDEIARRVRQMENEEK